MVRRWSGVEFPDEGWPGPPRLDSAVKLNADQRERMAAELALNFR
jgi:hypothetical protein